MCMSSCNAPCGICKAVGVVFALLAAFGLVAAIAGVYAAHAATGWAFGGTEESMSLLAFGLFLIVGKKMAKCCPCQRKGMCGGKPGCACGKEHCACGKQA